MDYSKWDNLTVEDDEEEEASLPNRAVSALPDVDAEAHAYLAEHAARVLSDVSQEDVAALLRFLRVQDPRGAASNVLACNQIVELLMQSPTLATKRTLNRTCALTRELCYGKGGAGAPGQVTAILLSAVNTLAACVEVGAINLFAIIATPRGDEAERLRLRYEDKAFGKGYMLWYMGWAEAAKVEDDDDSEGGWWCVVQ
jgi:hypothetical protein